MKNYIFIIFGFIGLTFLSLDGQEYSSPQTLPSHSPELKPIIQKLFLLSEARSLLDEAQKDGPIKIRTASLGKNVGEAMWCGDDRTIYLNSSHNQSKACQLRYILFEMQNAKTDRQFMQVDEQAEQGHLSKWAYVKSIERLEHQNALNTYLLIEKGIHLGYYPQEARWPVPKTFEEHYAMQLRNGHADDIASLYEEILASQRT